MRIHFFRLLFAFVAITIVTNVILVAKERVIRIEQGDAYEKWFWFNGYKQNGRSSPTLQNISFEVYTVAEVDANVSAEVATLTRNAKTSVDALTEKINLLTKNIETLSKSNDALTLRIQALEQRPDNR